MALEQLSYVCQSCGNNNIWAADLPNPKECSNCHGHNCRMAEASLRSRWTRARGKNVLVQLRAAWASGRNDWTGIIAGLPGSEEIANGRDLRFLADTYQYQIRGNVWSRADLSGAQISGVHFQDADLTETIFCNAALENSQFNNSIIFKANLKGAVLTNAIFHGGTIRNSNLEGIKFGPEHDPRHDGSSSVKFERRRIPLNWGLIRFVGKLPLFGVSWLGLIASISAVIIIGRLNDTRAISIINYPIENPERILWTLFGSVLLVIGTTIYKVACPIEIQEFSESEWVIQHRQPRLIYFSKCSRNYPAQLFSAFGIGIGGIISLFLIADRLLAAFRYIF